MKHEEYSFKSAPLHWGYKILLYVWDICRSSSFKFEYTVSTMAGFSTGIQCIAIQVRHLEPFRPFSQTKRKVRFLVPKYVSFMTFLHLCKSTNSATFQIIVEENIDKKPCHWSVYILPPLLTYILFTGINTCFTIVLVIISYCQASASQAGASTQDKYSSPACAFVWITTWHSSRQRSRLDCYLPCVWEHLHLGPLIFR